MGIEIRPSGEAAAYAQAGQTIGKGERAKEERARAERQQEQAAQQQARQTAMEWEMQKMLLNSQQDFAHEMRIRQADLDAEARAKEWEVEKMELHSKFDFEQDEKERLRINATYDAARETLEDNRKNMGDAEYEKALFELDSIYAPKGVTKAVTGLGLKAKTTLTPEEQAKKERIEAGLLPRAGQESGAAQYLKNLGFDNDAVADPGKVYVEKPNGVKGYIPAEQLEEALTLGYTLVKGQNISKSESYQKNLNQWLVEEKFPQLMKDIESPNPSRYFAAKQESMTLTKQYPSAFEQYLKKISGK